MSELVLENSDELPNGWSIIILQNYVNIAARIGWRGLKKSEYVNSGAFLLAVKDIEFNGTINFSGIRDYLSDFRYHESHEIQLKKNDILITKDGTIGKIGFVTELPGKTTVNSSILVVRPSYFICPRYLFYYFKSPFFQKIIKEKIKGTAVPHLFQYDIKNFKIYVAPINEQKRIVSKIEELFSKIDSSNQLIENILIQLKLYRKSILKYAINGKLTEKWRQENYTKMETSISLIKKIKDIKKSNDKKLIQIHPSNMVLPKIPHEWQWVRLGFLCDLITKGSSPSWQGISYTMNGTLFITSENVGNGRLILKNKKFVESRFDKIQNRSILHKGDLLTNIVGASIGRSALFNLNENANINQAVAIMRTVRLIDVNYILMILNSPLVVNFMHKEKVDVARANLSLEDISNIPIPLPSFNEQKDIANMVNEQLSIIENSQYVINKILAEGKRLKETILKSAFSGKLVPQDPEDEPISVILEKIKQEKEKLENRKVIKAKTIKPRRMKNAR